jgi:hypothetical protein
MRAVRLPVEPIEPLRRAFPSERYRAAPYNFAGTALRRRLRRAGLTINDHVFGLAWSGAMTEARVLGLLPHLPEGISELYFHPAVEQSPALAAAMPGYRNREELEALTSTAMRRRIDELGIALTTYSELAAPG